MNSRTAEIMGTYNILMNEADGKESKRYSIIMLGMSCINYRNINAVRNIRTALGNGDIRASHAEIATVGGIKCDLWKLSHASSSFNTVTWQGGDDPARTENTALNGIYQIWSKEVTAMKILRRKPGRREADIGYTALASHFLRITRWEAPNEIWKKFNAPACDECNMPDKHTADELKCSQRANMFINMAYPL